MLSGCGNDIEETPLSNSIPLTDDMTYITYQIKADNIDNELKSSAESILRMRLDSMGYTETTIQLEENNQISVILPAEIKIDEERAEFLAATPKLTFKDYKGNVLLTGQDIKQVNVEHGSLSDSGEEEYYLLLEFNKEGKSKFEEATTQISILSEPNNYIVISLDEMTISAPRVTESIKSGSCVINGNFDENSINELADNIRSALLCFSLEIVKINNSTTYATDSKNEAEKNTNGTLAEEIIGTWEADNGGIWEYKKDGVCTVDFSKFNMNDKSKEADVVRRQAPVSFNYTVDGEYLVYKMRAPEPYRVYTVIKGDIKYETDSVDGTTKTMKRITSEKADSTSDSDTKSSDPNVPYFLKTLGTVKNSDGTYSFRGYITGCKFFGSSATIYITASNGKEFSTGDDGLMVDLRKDIFVDPRTGNYSVMLNEIVENNSSIRRILFEFFFDEDGNYLRYTR